MCGCVCVCACVCVRVRVYICLYTCLLRVAAASQSTIKQALEEYNTSNFAMPLVLFDDAVTHVCRIARLISNPYGHGLLVGVGAFHASTQTLLLLKSDTKRILR